jgi:hypothetical protein
MNSFSECGISLVCKTAFRTFAFSCEGRTPINSFVVALLLAVAITGCTAAPHRPQELPLPPQRIAQPGYSLMPLSEKGWLFGPRSQYHLTLGKYGNNPDETVAIEGRLFQLPAYSTTEDFVRLIKDGQAADTDPVRFKVIKHEVVPDNAKNTDCARSHVITEDTKPVKRTAAVGAMILRVMTLTCAHPNNKKMGVNITYSHRYYAGNEDPQFDQKATQVFNSFEFAGLR